MDYKAKLQTNNTVLEGNNLDLQTILNTINSLPEAGTEENINLDAEITEQDSIIAQIQSALEGKTAGGESLDTSDATATAEDIATGKTAYVDGVKITGTHECSEGTSVETCTVVLPSMSSLRYPIFILTVVENGVITSVEAGVIRTINNVVCGSLLLFEQDIEDVDTSTFALDGNLPEWSIGTTYSIFTVPYKNGETIYLTESNIQDV